ISLSCLSVMRLRPPRHPLFPYTTLFRSCPHNMDTKRKEDPISTRSPLPTSCLPTITIQNVDMSASESSRSSTSGASQEWWIVPRSEEHTSELQSRFDLVCRLLLEKKKNA